MLLDAFSSVVNFIIDAGHKLGLSWISVIALGLTLITFVISFVVTQFSIELKTARAVEKINLYLESNPFINEENLVEFNKLMKNIPSTMRLQWQQYMVNRDKKPSEFFTEHNCVEKPFEASTYKTQIVAVRSCLVGIAVLAFIFSAGNISGTSMGQVLMQCGLLSGAIALLGEVYVLFLKARRNSALADLYYNFANFQKYLDRATTTLPAYIDYEILFTRKEITAGIPVLQEYLQQRAVYEQDQIQKAKESQVVHEQYDFSALGINGSLVMEKAMRECEFYLGNKKRVLAEISELEGQRDMLDKSYDEKNKTSQRKLRDIQDSLDRLKDKLDATTNIIVGNDLRKQRENEIQKQRQIEKESEDDNNKYNLDRKKVSQEIDDKKKEIEDFRKGAETSLNAEFKTYADKIYNQLKTTADDQVKTEVETVKADNEKLQQDLDDREKCIVEKNTLYDEKLAYIEQLTQKVNGDAQTVADAEEIKNQFNNAMGDKASVIKQKDDEIFDVKRELESRNLEIQKQNDKIQKQKDYIKQIRFKRKVDVYRYFDENGKEFFYDDSGTPYYLDENGQVAYKQNMPTDTSAGEYAEVAGLNDFLEKPETDEQANVSVEEQPSETENNVEVSEQVGSPITAEELNNTDNQSNTVEEPAQEQPVNVEEQPVDVEEQPKAEQAVENQKEQQPVETAPINQTEEKEMHVEPAQTENIVPDNSVKDEQNGEQEATEVGEDFDFKDFSWENSNKAPINETEVAEANGNDAGTTVEQKPETANEKPADVAEVEQKPTDADIDKAIAEQDEKLKSQTEELSQQLQKTKDVALEKPKKKKSGGSGNKSSGGAKPAKKASSSKKAESKPAKEKSASKAKATKGTKAEKPNAEVSFGDFTLNQFGDALNQAINKIDDDK